MNTRSLWRTGLLVLALAAPAAAQNRVVVLPESEVQIEGRSTVDDFTCRAGSVRGAGSLAGDDGVVQKVALGGRSRTAAQIRVPVTTFDCGMKRMNEDMYRALQAKEHPFIEYELGEAELLGTPGRPGDPYLLRVRGKLTIAGTTREVESDVRGEQMADGRLRATGRLPLKMTDFGIEPPKALLGLVRAHDAITVRFTLLAAPDEAQARHN